MRILLSNDDGYLAPGIRAMFAALDASEQVGDLVLIAPDRNRSAASNSLTLMNPLRITAHEDRVFSVTGTPTDCVHLGVNGALDYLPDMVVSGVNEGANLGDDVLYSGTVAAAMEGRFLGKPSIAVSLCGDKHYATAARVVCELIAEAEADLGRWDPSIIININVPDVPYEELRGIRVTRLGRRHPSGQVVREIDPRGKEMFWIGPAGGAVDAGEGTDFAAVEAGYVSITPLHIDLTKYDVLEPMAEWIADKWNKKF